MSAAAPPAGYRPCAAVMLFDRRGRVFVGRRHDAPDAWQVPQGGIDDGEAPRAAALRELGEEIGTANVAVLAESSRWHCYELPPEIAAHSWRGRYRGQAQKWLACRFLGTDAEIDVAGVAEPEFDAWRWVDIDALADLSVDFKRAVYAAVVDEFRHLATPA